VWELAVQRERQGRGIGRTLMETSIAAARQGGFRVVTLTTFRDVPWNAPFYRRLGFQILEPDKMSQRLPGVVTEESLRGLPVEYRCVMRLNLEPAPD
jgi:predicted N-acetyltransferase YhbS